MQASLSLERGVQRRDPEASSVDDPERGLHRAGAADLVTMLQAGLDLLAVGVALLDSQSQLRFANAAGLAAVKRIDLAEARLPRSMPPAANEWRRTLREACQSGQRRLIETCSGNDSPQYAVVIPLNIESDRWAWIVFGSLAVCGPLELQMFGARHRLTHAEKQVLTHLCEGNRLADVARVQGVAISTVRTQIASVRTKARASGIHDLLRAMSRLPPLRPPQFATEASNVG